MSRVFSHSLSLNLSLPPLSCESPGPCGRAPVRPGWSFARPLRYHPPRA